MTADLQIAVAALTVACTYALVGTGFSLIFNASNIINFAQGDLLMLGAMLTYTGATILHLPLVVSLVGSIAGMALIGVGMNYLLIEPIRRRQGQLFSMVMVTLAFSVVAESGSQVVWGPENFAISSFLGNLQLGGVIVTGPSLEVILAAVAVTLLLFVFIRFTLLGKAYMATASHREAALLIGIDVRKMVMLAFVLSGAVMAVAGTAVGALTSASSTMGFALGLNGFVAALVGGLRHPFGAVVGALTVGAVTEVFDATVGFNYVDAVTFAVLILILLVRPDGILGKRVERT